MSEVELTRDLLMDAGGWKVMKEAREMHRSGLVKEAAYEDGWLTGVVTTGGKPNRVRMQILSRTHLENKCPCFLARRDGRVCAHAVAVGLEVIEPTGRKQNDEQEETEEREEREEREDGADLWPAITEEWSEEANAIRCSVMLPLNVAASWERGQLMVGFGVEYEGEEQLLSEWGAEWTVMVGERDAALLEAVKRLFPRQPPGVVTLGRTEFLTLLDALAGHPRVWFGKKERAVVSSRALRPRVTSRGRRAAVEWAVGVTPLSEGGSAWVIEGTTLRPVASGVPESVRGVLDRGVTLAPVEAPAALRLLESWFEVDERLVAELPPQGEPRVEVRFEGSLTHLEATMTFFYGTHRRKAGRREVELVDGGSGGEVLTSPDLERAAEDVLRQFGFDGPGSRGEFRLRDRDAILRFHAHGLGRLDPEWTIVRGERFREFAKDIVPIAPVFDYRGSGEDWFAVEVEYRTADGAELSREEVQRMLRMGSSEQALGGSRIGVLDRALTDQVAETLSDCDPVQEAAGVFRIDARQAAYLREAARDLGVRTDHEGRAPRERRAGIPDEALGGLGGVLRPYQREGVEWLWRLAELRMGAILADDMGLGKTLQTLAFLKARGGPALVVCPSSLVANWIAEAQKFVPELRAVAIEGPERGARLAQSGEADLLVTSYALLRLDIDRYRDREFEVVVLDEAQQVKNPDAQVTKAAAALRGAFRIALSGTPIENSVRDLWSIVNLVLPGYLGGRREFAERFEKPLAGGAAPDLPRRLARRLRPIVKRRLKREVAKDLPAKIEQVRYCELSAKQRAVYETILRESRSMVLDAEGGRKRMVALTALLRLRQACCDLRLLDLPNFDEEDGSVKLEELETLLLEAVDGGHRVLVFSQFVRMLQGIVPLLAEHGLRFCYLDGQTKNRAEVVARFQGTPDIPVFLISLKAGGVGLNLTGADTVIHVDPWWNPAVEAQATDRAHRIGQREVVTSYKLITRHTVEEKILALQERKREMIAATLDAAELPAGAAGLSEDEIFELFG